MAVEVWANERIYPICKVFSHCFVLANERRYPICKVSSYWRRPYRCDIFSHWLGPRCLATSALHGRDAYNGAPVLPGRLGEFCWLTVIPARGAVFRRGVLVRRGGGWPGLGWIPVVVTPGWAGLATTGKPGRVVAVTVGVVCGARLMTLGWPVWPLTATVGCKGTQQLQTVRESSGGGRDGGRSLWGQAYDTGLTRLTTHCYRRL